MKWVGFQISQRRMSSEEKAENSIIQVGFVDVATRKLHFKDHLYRNPEMTFRVSRIGKQAMNDPSIKMDCDAHGYI